MNLFIRVVNGEPFEHPITDWNFYQIYPQAKDGIIPEGYARFVRVELDIPVGDFEVPVVSYHWAGDIVMDVWSVRSMTDEERIAKQKELDQILFEIHNRIAISNALQ